MYNLTYLGHRMTLPWLDLRSNFELDLSMSNYTWFDAPWRNKHDGIKIVPLPLTLNILSSKNRFDFFKRILTPGDLNFDLSQKMTEMISK